MNRQLILLIASLIAVVVLALYVFNIDPTRLSNTNPGDDTYAPTTTPQDGETPPPPTFEDTMPTTPPPPMPNEGTNGTSSDTETETPTDSASNPAARAVVTYVVETESITADDITVVSVTQNTWPNGCLGLAAADEMCTQALVPGFAVTLNVAGDTRVFRTDLSGNVIREDTASNE